MLRLVSLQVSHLSSHFAITPHQNEPLAEFRGTRGASKAREMPKEEFRREVEKELTGKDTEPSEIVYFKLYKSQIPVVEQAIETAALMLGTDKSRLLPGDDLRRLPGHS